MLKAFKEEIIHSYKKDFPNNQNDNIIDLIKGIDFEDGDKWNLEFYSSPASKEHYRNFLSWLFATFNQNELEFRKSLIEKLNLKKGQKVLITGCGFGDDIEICKLQVGPDGEIHAQDLSKEMVTEAAKNNASDNVMFSISNGLNLPYNDQYFDAVFHFGGINLFGDIKKAIMEMTRVCKVDGQVVFGDEGVAEHLRKEDYGKIAINNNSLWSYDPPLEHLPINAFDIELSYVLGNCFYIISYKVGEGEPYMNIDLIHKGLRGGSARTRYYGQLEGVSDKAKEKIVRLAKKNNISISELLTNTILDLKE
ncbi:class I SAM-dependent methyltransferase [Pseudemcibacter aquimaris]|uniref:class I SAM-dependent methyltransferase n=1 Tax=Pseudemcibacter aquimaris TaxID=2857064 RepID=UPI0020117AC3|nr:methyltransferase domain-containing protein [Pseudemcibacter aquimaris]MCC3860005.1 methyltransferase domain-containing protein [Pseudemcibacter aquimaris]WDU57336.1 methyltransferase domain-containing protein [Pseudemcibacter aquimaris]